jgi:hypothetical protein
MLDFLAQRFRDEPEWDKDLMYAHGAANWPTLTGITWRGNRR